MSESTRTDTVNDTEAELIASLTPKKQMLIKRPDMSKVVQLNVASKDYWIYTNSPFDNERKRKAFESLGFERGLEFLARQTPGTGAGADTMDVPPAQKELQL